MSKIGKQLNQEEIILVKPHITEKATALATGDAKHPVYVFQVSPDARKNIIASAIKKLFNVTPVKINIINVKAKKIMPRGRRGRPGHSAGFKKALVMLKKGDKIETV